MIKTKEDLKMTFFRKDDTAVLEKVVNILELNGYPEKPDAFYFSFYTDGDFEWMPFTCYSGSSKEWYIKNGYREITTADFEEEDASQESLSKQDLTGIKVRIENWEQWENLKSLCESVGLEHAQWHDCDYREDCVAFMCGHDGVFLASDIAEEVDNTSEPYRNLREIDYHDIFKSDEEDVSKKQSPSQKAPSSQPKYRYVKVDLSPADIYRAMLDGETFYIDEMKMRWKGDSFYLGDDRITYISEDNEICRREEIKWQDEVISFIESGGVSSEDCKDEHPVTISFYDGESWDLTGEDFLEAARIALRAIGELKD